MSDFGSRSLSSGRNEVQKLNRLLQGSPKILSPINLDDPRALPLSLLQCVEKFFDLDHASSKREMPVLRSGVIVQMEMNKSFPQAMGRLDEIKSLECGMTDIDQSLDLLGRKKMNEIGKIRDPAKERRIFHPNILYEKKSSLSFSGLQDRLDQPNRIPNPFLPGGIRTSEMTGMENNP